MKAYLLVSTRIGTVTGGPILFKKAFVDDSTKVYMNMINPALKNPQLKM